MLALAVAMGIGRFASTPLLPMMLQAGELDIATAAWLASANYLGYLVGALLCMVQPWVHARTGWRWTGASSIALLRGGLVATCVLTLGMALRLPAAWPWLRFAAGIASAFVFVHSSGWCLGRLARLGVPAMGALIYVGPGAGIVTSGLAATAMLAAHWPSWIGWAVFGALAAVLTAIAWPAFDVPATAPTVEPSKPGAEHGAAPSAAPAHGRLELGLLVFAYGIAGFGYIISATFLPVIARQALPGSPWLDLFWPLLGAGVMAGALLASRVQRVTEPRLWLAACYAIQALGIGAGLVAPNLAGFALGSLLLGLPFTVISYFAMQEARRVQPRSTAAFIGLLTAVYGVGQIVGPPLASALLTTSANGGARFDTSLQLAAAALGVGAVLFVAMVRRWPAHARRSATLAS